MIKAVIFDCDGVLVDSREANIATYQNLLKRAGYPVPSREAVLQCFHLPARESLAQLTGSSEPKEINRIMGLIDEGGIRDNSLFKFPVMLKNVLQKLHGHYQLGIATSRINSGMNDVLGTAGIRQYFKVVVVREQYVNSKPHPESLLLAANKLHVEPSEAIYIGDSHTDIEAAKAAGMKSIHLAPIKHKDADVGITSFKQIPGAVKQLTSD